MFARPTENNSDSPESPALAPTDPPNFLSRLTRRQFLLLTGATAVGALVPGCGGGSSGPTQNQGRAVGGVTGILFKDAAGTLVLGRVGGTAPAGTTPVNGATLRVTSAGAQTRSDANGRFEFRQIPAGYQSLAIEAPGLPPTNIPLTIIGGTTVDIGVPTVTRVAALQAAKSALTGAGITDLSGVTILSPQHPLPAGVLVVPRLDAATISASVPNSKTVAAPSWFFFCDNRVGHPFAHVVWYVYVDAETGAATVEERMSWPTVNLQHFYARAEMHAASPDLLQPGRAASLTSPSRSSHVTRLPSAPTRGGTMEKTHGIQIYGFTEHDTLVNFLSLPGHAGIPADLGTWSIVSVKNTPAGVYLRDRAIAETKALVAAAGTHDFLLIDINSHGGLDDNGEYLMWMPSPEMFLFDTGIFSHDNEILRPQELGLAAAVACKILIIAGTCYAGNWVDYARQSLDLPGKEVTVFAAAPSQRVSWGPLKSGFGTWNAYMFREEVFAEGASTGQAGLLAAAGRAVTRSQAYFNNDILTDDRFKESLVSYATFWSRTPAEGEDCELSIVPAEMTAAINEIINFEVKVNNRPANAPPLRIVVSTSLGDISTAAGAGKTITITKSESVAFVSSDAGDAIITAEAFENSGSGEESIGKATAKITVGLGGGLVYSQIQGNIRGEGFPQLQPGEFHEVNFPGVPPLYNYQYSGKIPPPAATVNTREVAVLLSRDIPVGTRVAILGGAVGNPIAEMVIAETENVYNQQGDLIQYRERAFRGISGHVTLVKIEGLTRTVRVENVKMTAYDRPFGGDDMGTPISVDGTGTFVVNGSITAIDNP
jgi:hypothetical protein